MWRKIKKVLAISVNPLIFILLFSNVTAGIILFKHFAIPSMAYAYTVVIMMIRYDSTKYRSRRVDWFAKINFDQPRWQFRMGRLFCLFIVISLIFYGFMWVMNR